MQHTGGFTRSKTIAGARGWRMTTPPWSEAAAVSPPVRSLWSPWSLGRRLLGLGLAVLREALQEGARTLGTWLLPGDAMAVLAWLLATWGPTLAGWWGRRVMEAFPACKRVRALLRRWARRGR